LPTAGAIFLATPLVTGILTAQYSCLHRTFNSKLEGRARSMQLQTRVLMDVFGLNNGVNVVGKRRIRVIAMLLRLNL
jgi:hypothetical protein